MDNLARLRQTRSRVVKVQRRIWLAQAALWPAVTFGCIAAAVGVAALARRRYKAAAAGGASSVGSPSEPSLYGQAAADCR